jgi:hypothetical protein
MAYNARKTEHVGSKKAKGAYAGRKRYAKHESNRERRRHDAVAVEDGLGEENSADASKRQINDG